MPMDKITLDIRRFQKLKRELRIKTNMQLADALLISPQALYYWLKQKKCPTSWLLKFLGQYQVSPVWTMSGKGPMFLSSGYSIEKPTTSKSNGTPDLQIKRLQILFPEAAKPSYLLCMYPKLKTAPLPLLKIQAANALSDTFLLKLHICFGVNPLWIINGKAPAIYDEKQIPFFTNKGLRLTPWSLVNNEVSV